MIACLLSRLSQIFIFRGFRNAKADDSQNDKADSKKLQRNDGTQAVNGQCQNRYNRTG